MLDGGVPISASVAGIAMGLMTEHDNEGTITKYKILTDLSGTEDFTGDMDFKVAGTSAGITAIQLDTKIPGLTPQIIRETIQQAHVGRDQILEFMAQTIATPRPALSPYAPKVVTFMINPEKIREVIGKGGEMIDKIILQAGGKVKIDFEDDGTVYISEVSQEAIDMAIRLIKDIADDLPLNTPLTGKITRVEAYGVFVELGKNKT